MITIDAKALAQMQRVLRGINNGVPRVLVPAINRTLSSGQTALRREIRKIYTIKQKDIPTKIRRATRETLGGEIRIEQGMLGADKFVYRPHAPTSRRRPLYVQIRRDGGGYVAQGFVSSGLSGPYQRRSGAGRLPIRKIIAIGAPIMASQPSVGPAVNEKMAETLGKRLEHEFKRVLESAGAKQT
jgi:hypothetical protein